MWVLNVINNYTEQTFSFFFFGAQKVWQQIGAACEMHPYRVFGRFKKGEKVILRFLRD